VELAKSVKQRSCGMAFHGTADRRQDPSLLRSLISCAISNPHYLVLDLLCRFPFEIRSISDIKRFKHIKGAAPCLLVSLLIIYTMSSFHLRPVSQSPQSPSPSVSTTSNVDRGSPFGSKPTPPSPPAASMSRIRRPMSPSSLRGEFYKLSPMYCPCSH